jgi:hypothetical protein
MLKEAIAICLAITYHSFDSRNFKEPQIPWPPIPEWNLGHPELEARVHTA